MKLSILLLHITLRVFRTLEASQKHSSRLFLWNFETSSRSPRSFSHTKKKLKAIFAFFLCVFFIIIIIIFIIFIFFSLLFQCSQILLSHSTVVSFNIENDFLLVVKKMFLDAKDLRWFLPNDKDEVAKVLERGKINCLRVLNY